jgi:hypothetical protein
MALTNPLLDPQLLAQAAQQVQQTAPPIIRPPSADTQPPPLSMSPQMSTPPTLAPPAEPNVTRIPTQLDNEKTEQARKVNTGSGISQIQGKVEGAMPNHPLAGKLLGGAAQGLATLGDVGLRAVAPSVDLALPGTSLHHLADLHQGNKQIAADEGNAEKEAQTTNLGASTNEANARAALTQAQVANSSQADADRHALTQAQIDKDEQDKAKSLTQMHADAVGKAIAEGRDPHADPNVNNLADMITSLQPGQNKEDNGAPKTIQIEVGGRPHQMAWNPATKKYDLDQGESGERPPSINIGDREAAALKKQVFTAYTPVMDSAERFNVMSKNYEDAIKTHDQQAMLSLLYNHMGMTMGLQKGARMTQALIAEAQKSQPWLQGMKAKFDNQGYLTGVTLSPQQMQEMVHNAQGRYSEDVGKARNESQYLGSKDDGPSRTPNSSTINYYMSQANGDMNKAKQLAAQDGWTVK